MQTGRLSERQYFVIAFIVLAVLLSLGYVIFLRPQLQERAILRQEIESKTQQLARTGYLQGEGPLLRRKAEMQQHLNRRKLEWSELQEQLSSLKDPSEEGGVEVGVIDYKFHLYLVRERLRRKARAQKIQVPALLGLQDEVMSNEVARERMLQLRAVERLVDTAIEYGIADIRSIDPLPLIQHQVSEGSESFLEEYPLRVTFEGDMEGLYKLWQAMFQQGRAMLLRNIAMEKTQLRQPNEVRMTATLSAFLFGAGEKLLQEQVSPAQQRTRARGH